MSPQSPTCDDIIFALEALGFDVEEEDELSAILSDGNYEIKLYQNPSAEQLKKTREELTEIFADYAEEVEEMIDEDYEDYDDSLKEVASWLKKG